MNSHAEKTNASNRRIAVAQQMSSVQTTGQTSLHPITTAQRKLQQAIATSARSQQATALQRVASSKMQAKKSHSQAGANIVQRVVSDAEIKKLEDSKLEGNSCQVMGYTIHESAEKTVAIGPGKAFRLIRNKNGGFYWRKQKIKHTGKGFYGRLDETSFSMQDAANYTQDKHDTFTYVEFEDDMEVFFRPSTNPESRDNNNSVLGKYLFPNRSSAPGISASYYAGEANFEWLHMHGHGLGGAETAANLFAGSHGANSMMAALETAVQAYQEVADIEVRVTPCIDSGFHNQNFLERIHALVGGITQQEAQYIQRIQSRRLRHVKMQIRVNGKNFEEVIDGNMPQMNFDLFYYIKSKVESFIIAKGESASKDISKGLEANFMHG